ncbi:hypothetical protein FIBSPDRAFT_941414 [Athelia psychrophila]|uniref:Uncharacterized protein n=1 Tax=Athelia psychrophila TaxID=1759441 RepID=A0A167U6J2_9AGAM|nr:hypothetical protein FIBSPDRAFT_941414 [Fibularhizoctonia sp. CBS 109695]
MEIDAVSATQDVLIHNYLQFFATMEITCIWARPKGLVSYLFIANRYLALFGNIVALYINLLNIPSEFHILNRLGILAVRMYALYARDRRIVYLFIALAILVIAVISAVFTHQDVKTVTSVRGCNIAHTVQNGIRLAVPWECVLVLDVIILGLTVFKTHASIRQGASGRHMPTTVHIPKLIIRDGALYFVGMVVTNTLNIMCFYLAAPIIKGSMSTFASVMSVTLISRVILNLREVVEASRASVNFETVSYPKWNGGSNQQTSYSSKLGPLVQVVGSKTAVCGWDMHMKVIDISRTRQYPDLELQRVYTTY